jgi:hypothetical protein
VRTREAFFTQWGDRRDQPQATPTSTKSTLSGLICWSQFHAGPVHHVGAGCGFGYWLANAAAALKQFGNLPYTFIGVEGEPTHFRWMKENLIENRLTSIDAD